MGKASFIFKAVDVLTNLIMNPARIKGVTQVIDEKYDFYYLDNHTANKPIIINIHGGGFLAGDKKYRRYWCEILAQNDWFVINANYRLCPTVTIIEQIKDVWGILTQVESIAHRYQLDCQTIVITGDSAGAFLAAYMLALMHNQDLRQKFQVNKIDNIKIAGALLFCGVYDFASMVENCQTNGNAGLIKDMAQHMTGLKFKSLADLKNYEFYPYLAIPKFVNKDWCPVQIFYSQKDFFVKGQGELFYDALKTQGVPVRQHYTKRIWDNHCYHLFFRTKVSKDSLKITKDFLAKIRHKAKIE